MPSKTKPKAKKPAAKQPTPKKPAKAKAPAGAGRAAAAMLDEVITEVAGKDVLALVKILRNKKNVSEFTLAEALTREINATRNMLYRLYEHNLVTFIRRKDKKKGWYIYYWTFNPPRIKDIYITLRKRKLEKLQERLEREQKTQFYVCYQKERLPDGTLINGPVTMRLDFDQAMNYEFKCPESGQLLEQEDNTQRIKQIEEEIQQIKKELKALE